VIQRGGLFVALAVILATGRARADDRPFTIGPQPTWFLLGGVTSGGTVALADRGAFVGGEVSFALKLPRFRGRFGGCDSGSG